MFPGRDLLDALKSSAGAAGPRLVIPIGSPPEAFLRPVATCADRLDPADVHALTLWRNRHLSAFLTEFEATEVRTARWLAETVHGDGGKILFMTEDTAGRAFGYMGLAFIDWSANSGEADAVVRGEAAPAGTMTRALGTLLRWAGGQLGLTTLGVRVRSDNLGALRFYERVGFHRQHRSPLRRIEEPGLVRWVEARTGEFSEVSLVHMHYRAPIDVP